jgi:neutral ceramidase
MRRSLYRSGSGETFAFRSRLAEARRTGEWLLLALIVVAAQVRAEFSVGAAYQSIMPAGAMRNYYRSNHEIAADASPLRVHVIVCSDGQQKVAVLSVDCTFLGRTEVLRIRDALRWRIGIAPEYVCVAATHTHAAPATTASFLAGELPDPQYIDFLVEQAASAAEVAAGRMRPARIAAAIVSAPPIIACRRRVSPDGQAYMVRSAPDDTFPEENPIDREMGYIVFVDLAGKPLAVLFNFGCHNNMVGGVLSADMFGRAGEVLREHLGDVATVSLAAPCGDVSFAGPDGKKLVSDDRAAGRAIAGVILESYRKVERSDPRALQVRSVVRRIPDRPYDPADFAYDNGRGSSASAVAFHKLRYEPEEKAVRARGRTFCDVEVQAITIGAVAIVTNPAELFSVFGLSIRQRSPFPITIVSELTNGYCGYVPTQRSFKHGGYETYRTVYTSRLAKDAGDQIVDLSLELLRGLKAEATGKSRE